MRVISGQYRGVPLIEFKGDAIRPTADRTKENLFNILQNRIAGKSFLDLFCGTGGIGIEALSRSAEVVFVDEAKASVELTKKNLAKLKIDATVILSDSISYLSRTTKKFDLIYVDPPYESDIGIKALNLIAEKRLLNAGGQVIFERDRAFTESVNGLTKVDERKYGKAYVTFFSVTPKAE